MRGVLAFGGGRGGHDRLKVAAICDGKLLLAWLYQVDEGALVSVPPRNGWSVGFRYARLATAKHGGAASDEHNRRASGSSGGGRANPHIFGVIWRPSHGTRAGSLEHPHQHRVPGYRRVPWRDSKFHPPIVSSVTSPRGTACGLVCLLREIPTLIAPCHVIGGIDELRSVKAVARVPIHPVDAFGSETVSKDTASAAVHMELKLDPETLFFHSPPPSAGRPLDHNHLDYVAVAVRYPYPRERLRRLEDAAEVVAPRTRMTLFAAPGEWHELTSDDPEALSRRAKRYHLTSASAAACISSRGGAAAAAEVLWRPGWVTSSNAPPRRSTSSSSTTRPGCRTRPGRW